MRLQDCLRTPEVWEWFSLEADVRIVRTQEGFRGYIFRDSRLAVHVAEGETLELVADNLESYIRIELKLRCFDAVREEGNILSALDRVANSDLFDDCVWVCP